MQWNLKNMTDLSKTAKIKDIVSGIKMYFFKTWGGRIGEGDKFMFCCTVVLENLVGFIGCSSLYRRA